MGLPQAHVVTLVPIVETHFSWMSRTPEPSGSQWDFAGWVKGDPFKL
jgi:hypothetical protein